MPINPNNMRVVDVARLLNSTEQGFVLAQARLYRDFNRVGFRIAATDNSRNINLLKYIVEVIEISAKILLSSKPCEFLQNGYVGDSTKNGSVGFQSKDGE